MGICEIFPKEKGQHWKDCFFPPTFVFHEMVKQIHRLDPQRLRLGEYSALRRREIHNMSFSKWVRSRRCGCLVSWFCYQMIDQPSSIFPVTVSDIDGKHSNIKYKNAKVGGNGDHTSNTAVTYMNAYMSVKYYLQLRWWSPNPNSRG